MAESSEDPGTSLATYRRTISERELESWLRHAASEGAEDAARRDADRRAAELEQLILTRSLADEALRLGLDRRPDVRVALDQAQGQLAVQALRRHVDASIVIDDGAVEAKYQEIKDTYALPRRLRLRNLFKRFPADATGAQKEDLRRQMESLRRQILDGADFAALASRESDSHTRLRGGLLGNVRPGTLRPSVDAVAMQLGAGEVSVVLEEPEGLTLIFCEQVLEKKQYSAEEMRGNARRLLRNQAWRGAWETMENRLLERAGAVWRPEALKAPIDPSAVLVELLGRRLSVAEVHALVAPRRPLEALARFDLQTLQDRTEPFLRGLMAVREVVVLGLDDEAFTERERWTRLRLLASKAIAEHVSRRMEPVGDGEADALAQAAPDLFPRVEHVRTRVIALPFEADDPRPAFALAEQLERLLDEDSSTFAQLAARHSVDSSRARGGELPALPRNGLASRLGFDAARALGDMHEPGARSGWVRDDDRRLLWWIELREVEPARDMTPQEAREPARRLLGQERAETARAAFLEEWLSGLELRREKPQVD